MSTAKQAQEKAVALLAHARILWFQQHYQGQSLWLPSRRPWFTFLIHFRNQHCPCPELAITLLFCLEIVLSRSHPRQFKSCVLERNFKTKSTFNKDIASQYHLSKQYQILSLYFPISVLTKLSLCTTLLLYKNFKVIYIPWNLSNRGKHILHSSQIRKCGPHKVCVTYSSETKNQ